MKQVDEIRVLDDSPLRAVVPADRMTVSCYHHQGISRLGDGLQATAFAEDGTIEAVSLGGHEGWYLGVQWHPEDTAAEDVQQAAVFEAFVHAVRDSLPERRRASSATPVVSPPSAPTTR